MTYATFGLPRESINPESRVRVQSTTTIQDGVTNGFVYMTSWREDNIPNGEVVYAEFTIPENLAMSLNKRVINPSGDNFKYKVFPEGTYTVSSSKLDDADSFAKTRNNRQGSGESQNLVRVNLSVEPDPLNQIVYIDSFGADGQGNRASGSLSSADDFLIFNSNQKFLLQLTNNGSNSASVSVILEFILFPESILP